MDEALRSVKAKRSDVAIRSHPHDDHVGNLIALVEEVPLAIERVRLSDSAWWSGTATNRRIRELFAREGVPVELADGRAFRLGGGEWLISNPPRGEFAGGALLGDRDDQAASEAANVLVVELSFNGVRALFTGDGGQADRGREAIADISVARRPE